MKTFTEATDTFLLAADWLGDEDLPAVIALQHAAKSLDKDATAAMLSQYRLIYNGLDKKRPTVAEVSELDDLLDGDE